MLGAILLIVLVTLLLCFMHPLAPFWQPSGWTDYPRLCIALGIALVIVFILMLFEKI